MDTTNIKVYLSGPNYYPEEENSMNFLGNYLEKSGFQLFSTSRHGFQKILSKKFIIEKIDNDKLFTSASILAFALEYYQIINADVCVGFMNGRVPDESTVIKMGIAFGNGIPVILFKLDPRILFPTGLNSMISGLSGNFKSIKNIKKLVQLIHIRAKKTTKTANIGLINKLPPFHQYLYALGNDINAYLTRNAIKELAMLSWEEINNIITTFSKNESFLRLIPGDFSTNYNPILPNNLPKIAGKVYCSGPLFCPEEVRDMKNIANALESYGLKTFLPQRDGGEPFVINSIDSPLAGLIIAKPLAKLLNKILFSIDISAIINCDYFVLNLNGRVPDDGAMAELGVAFAIGKPIIMYHDDLRILSSRENLPTLQAVAYGKSAVQKYENIAPAMENLHKYLINLGENHYAQNLSETLQKIVNYGEKWIARLKNKKKPINLLETWGRTK